MACQGHRSRAWQGEDGRAKPRQASWTVRLRPGRTALAEPSLPQGWSWGCLGHCRDVKSREQDYRKQLCSLLGSMPGGSTGLLAPVRLEGEGKEKTIFSLCPQSTEGGRGGFG